MRAKSQKIKNDFPPRGRGIFQKTPRFCGVRSFLPLNFINDLLDRENAVGAEKIIHALRTITFFSYYHAIFLVAVQRTVVFYAGPAPAFRIKVMIIKLLSGHANLLAFLAGSRLRPEPARRLRNLICRGITVCRGPHFSPGQQPRSQR